MKLYPVHKQDQVPKRTLSIRLDQGTFDQLQTRTDGIGITVSEAVRQLIQLYLEQEQDQ